MELNPSEYVIERRVMTFFCDLQNKKIVITVLSGVPQNFFSFFLCQQTKKFEKYCFKSKLRDGIAVVAALATSAPMYQDKINIYH